MVTLLVALHVLVCIILILVILLQAGKGAEMGATFGVGSSSPVFGPRGPAPLLAKLTVGAAVIFMATSLVLTIFASRQEMPSLLKSVQPPAVEKPPLPRPVPPAGPQSKPSGEGTSSVPSSSGPSQGGGGQSHGR
ncbi:MAG: preprotein translocase subunit SecG [Aquificota bacterium]|nr:MAG: preprotein translocase subunit SecG [Aquificota bacterium]